MKKISYLFIFFLIGCNNNSISIYESLNIKVQNLIEKYIDIEEVNIYISRTYYTTDSTVMIINKVNNSFLLKNNISSNVFKSKNVIIFNYSGIENVLMKNNSYLQTYKKLIDSLENKKILSNELQISDFKPIYFIIKNDTTYVIDFPNICEDFIIGAKRVKNLKFFIPNP